MIQIQNNIVHLLILHAGWVAIDRWNALTPEQQIGFAPSARILFLSCALNLYQKVKQASSLAELRNRMVEYMASGLRLGWLINPQDQQVEIYRAVQAVEVVSMPTLLSGEAVLPGFELSV